jgi:hypothetical protein
MSRGFAGISAVVLLMGCNGYERMPETPIVQSQSVAGSVPPSANDSSGTGFYDFMQTVTWVQKKNVDMCTNSVLCYVGLSKKVKVSLEVSQNSYLVDPRAVDPNGVLLVRAVNKEHNTTAQYHFRPGFIYSLVAYPDSVGATTSHWLLMETDTTTHHTAPVSGIQGPYTPCWDSPPATSDNVDLYKCGEAHAPPAAFRKSAMDLIGFLDHFLMSIGESPIWKSCPAGCCTLATE